MQKPSLSFILPFARLFSEWLGAIFFKKYLLKVLSRDILRVQFFIRSLTKRYIVKLLTSFWPLQGRTLFKIYIFRILDYFEVLTVNLANDQLPAASYALASIVWVAFGLPGTFQLQEYGLDESEHISPPFA